MTTTTTISSQRYLDDATVESKRAAADYVVTVYRVEIADQSYNVIVDGHHSLAAAMADGVEPDYEDVCDAIANEFRMEIEEHGVDAWLETHSNGDAYYDVTTGREVW